MKIVYAPVKIKVDELKIVEELKKIGGKKAVVTVNQYAYVLKNIDSKFKGVVLGCDASILKGFAGDTIVFIGEGRFHALNIKNSYKDKRVLTIDPYTFAVSEITESDIKKFALSKALGLDRLKTAKNVGIIVSTKNGQNRTIEALALKKKLESENKIVYLFLFDNVNPDEFLNFKGLDLVINTACPRISMDDSIRFPIPVLDYNIIIQR